MAWAWRSKRSARTNESTGNGGFRIIILRKLRYILAISRHDWGEWYSNAAPGARGEGEMERETDRTIRFAFQKVVVTVVTVVKGCVHDMTKQVHLNWC